MDAGEIGARRWLILAVGVLAQAAQATIVNGVAFLIPSLHTEAGLSLAQAGTLAGAPLFGGVFTLVMWGAISDRFGERFALTAGLGLASAATAAATLTTSIPALGILLVLAGAGAVSANAASGRVVVGWFAPRQRGLAMGIRQMSVPLGVAAGALVIPPVAAHHGVAWALAFPALACGIAALACVLGILDPPRPDRAEAQRTGMLANPYRSSWTLARIHAASILLVVPQYVVWTYSLVWLITDRAWDETGAGLLITVAQILAALGRVAAGSWSDRVGSRLGPMRLVAVSVVLAMVALAATSLSGSVAAVVVLLVASVLTSAPNGLAFTAVAEIAGPYWGGRALGVQNTGQFVAAAAVGPVFGALIAVVGFPAAFAIAAVAPAAAAPVIPKS
ncbi:MULTISPECIES: MFS transporter [unclassified Rhodococcus (in: high G+C Gram-positive bacteria)]|jgi:MFS family permease|uniref:MFS transporter n=1 Tax=unclassified Rhodococcus (in: high G+C Gram-positive bacteria) TaxID=192944 RepID=UPI00146B4AE8|nr:MULTISPECIES: MFS transporter [unclassified Rhodococcus (in: high G+C Gram-positive bacteria)]MBF0661843.1 MFS transporter [Rhodococcus sp. (in: high G+C Gram-positive bacteria)]NMD94287.1 MFS transporter [Rhodococcus sp. BL-253-APC-6A1W]NME78557.1 MFS transporter [Rhodococcus sp. 105337]